MNRNNKAIRVQTVLRADLGCSVNGNNLNTREVCVTGSVCARCQSVVTSASKSSIQRFVITEKAPTRAYKTLC